MMRKRGFSLVSLLLILSLLFSCSDERSFNHCELYITLPEDFEDVGSSDSFDLLLSNGEVSVGIARISFTAGYNQGIPDTLTDKAFGEFFIKQSGKSLTVYTYGGVPYVSYTEIQDGEPYYCLASFYRSLHAYFFILYSTDGALEDKWREDFLKFATGVSFKY